MALVRSVETLTVRTVGTEREPERVLKRAVVDVGLDLRTLGLAIGGDAVEAVREQVAGSSAEDDDRRELLIVGQRPRVFVDDLVVDGRAGLGAGISDETVERENLAHRSTRRRIRNRGSCSHDPPSVTNADYRATGSARPSRDTRSIARRCSRHARLAPRRSARVRGAGVPAAAGPPARQQARARQQATPREQSPRGQETDGSGGETTAGLTPTAAVATGIDGSADDGGSRSLMTARAGCDHDIGQQLVGRERERSREGASRKFQRSFSLNP